MIIIEFWRPYRVLKKLGNFHCQIQISLRGDYNMYIIYSWGVQYFVIVKTSQGVICIRRIIYKQQHFITKCRYHVTMESEICLVTAKSAKTVLYMWLLKHISDVYYHMILHLKLIGYVTHHILNITCHLLAGDLIMNICYKSHATQYPNSAIKDIRYFS